MVYADDSCRTKDLDRDFGYNGGLQRFSHDPYTSQKAYERLCVQILDMRTVPPLARST